MIFSSILCPVREIGVDPMPSVSSDVFRDLNLDQVIAAITAGKEEYDLVPFFRRPLQEVDDIVYRHEIFLDLENTGLLEDIGSFADLMRDMRACLARGERARYVLQAQRWFLDAVALYCDAVTQLADRLTEKKLRSRGLVAFRDYLRRYLSSDRFTRLHRQTQKLEDDLHSIRYCLVIDGLSVEVRKYDGENDYSAEIRACFERFQQGDAHGYEFDIPDSLEVNHVEAKILELLTQIYPATFAALDEYCRIGDSFSDPAIIAFDREIEFYTAYLEYVAPLKQSELNFCYPDIGRASKEVYADRSFDLALAHKLVAKKAVPVRNDFHLMGRERIIVVSGPNQGGKTTFSRMFGQLHYLGALGCPVPGERAKLFLFDNLFTHFEREEHGTSLRGKLQDDLMRIHEILESVTPGSIVITNEIFTSTTFRDATVLSKKIMARIMQLDLLCIWVTFIDELASLGPQNVSMVSTVEPHNPAMRTYKIVQRPADGLAHALSIAEKYRLTYGLIKERVGS